MRGLLNKEFREHGFAFGLFSLTLILLYGLLLFSLKLDHNRASYFQPFRLFLILATPVLAFFVSQRLICKEFSGKTQFFLEALPVGRTQVFCLKWLLGLFATLAVVGIAFGITYAVAAHSEFLSAEFTRILMSRWMSYVLFIYAFAAALSYLGRFRFLALIAVVIGLVVVNGYSQLDITRQGPFALILDRGFAFEREIMPLSNLQTAWVGTVILAALSFMMSQFREGSTAVMLAQKMSLKEKFFVAFILVATTFLITVLETRQPKEPFKLVDATVHKGQGVAVHLSETGLLDENQPQQFTQWLHEELVGVKTFLGLNSLPPVFITIRRDLDPDKFELGALSEAEGIMARVNYNGEDWPAQRFLTWFLPRLLINESDGRAALERNRWLLDGFSQYWASRKSDPSKDRVLMLRALYGTPDGISTNLLKQWLKFRERQDPAIAKAVAWSGLKAVEKLAGAEACQNLLRSKLAQPLPKDMRATLHELSNPIQKALNDTTGLSMEHLLLAWNQELSSQRQWLAPALAELPQIAGDIKIINLSSTTFRIEYRLRQNLPSSTRIRFNYVELPLGDREINPKKVKREEKNAGELKDWNKLPKTFSLGSRFAWAFTTWSSVLECEISSGWKRLEIR